MRKFNLLSEYPKSQTTRYVGSNLRTIDHRIVASYRDQRFYDGDRNFGYGGFKYDGRWKIVAKAISERYLEKSSRQNWETILNQLNLNCLIQELALILI